jgi:hypothetical protein
MALSLARRGWPVFPVLPGSKEPALHGNSNNRPCPRTGICRNGHQGWETIATTDLAAIERYGLTHPRHNWGVATGPAGLVVVDLDVHKTGKKLPADCQRVGAVHGAQMLSRLAASIGEVVPDTYTVRTPSGGTHFFYRQPAGLATEQQLRATVGRIGLVDTRAWGGYVVAPGSVIVGRDGAVIGAYELIDDTDPVALPPWLADVFGLSAPVPDAARTPIRAANGTSTGDRYVDRAVEGEQAHIRDAADGEHNRAQWTAGLALGQLVGVRRLGHEQALEKLLDAAAVHITGTCRCTERGVRAAIEWGLTKGAENHRTVPDSERRSA